MQSILVTDDAATTTLATESLSGISSNWSKITATLRPNDTDSHARMAVFLQGPGTVDFDMISLFPQKTWKNRPGGLRADMVQMLADLHPGFLRFPGGCIVEGSDLSKRYQWKNTIGPIDDRRLLVNRWNLAMSLGTIAFGMTFLLWILFTLFERGFAALAPTLA